MPRRELMNFKRDYDGKTTFQFFDERSDKVDYRTPSEGGVEL